MQETSVLTRAGHAKIHANDNVCLPWSIHGGTVHCRTSIRSIAAIHPRIHPGLFEVGFFRLSEEVRVTRRKQCNQQRQCPAMPVLPHEALCTFRCCCRAHKRSGIDHKAMTCRKIHTRSPTQLPRWSTRSGGVTIKTEWTTL